MGQPIRVLYVDNTGSTGHVPDRIEQSGDGFSVERAGTVDEARSLVEERVFDCVVAESETGDRTGIDLLESVREEYPDLPFVLYTGAGDERTASEGISARVSTSVRKGPGENDLATVRDAIESAVDGFRPDLAGSSRLGIERLFTEVNRKLVEATDREEVEQTVCDVLSSSAPYDAAWIGYYDPDMERVNPRIWANIENDFFDGFTLSTDAADSDVGIVPEAIHTGEIQAVNSLDSVSALDAPERLDQRGVHSAAAVPLISDETVHGVLGIHADRPYAFDRFERRHLADLGDTIAFALDTFETRRDLALFRQLLDSSNDAVYVIDPQTQQFADVNRTACRRLGYERETMVGMSPPAIVDSVAGHDIDDVDAVLEGLTEDGTVIEGTHERADGTTFPVETSTTRATVDGNPYVILIARDITERKRRERKLREQNERLEAFANVVSHDLRNPLQVALGNLKLARAESDSEHLDAVADALGRMGTLIEELLTLTHDGDEVAEQTVDLASIAEGCWSNVVTEDATLEIETDTTVRANENGVKQLLENLFRNAIEHGGAEVTITVADLDDRDGFYVADDGAGFSGTDLEDLFRSGQSTKSDGTGIGLAIVRQISRVHDWEVDATDSSGGGARFEIWNVERAG